jgi:hypothetical protein
MFTDVLEREGMPRRVISFLYKPYTADIHLANAFRRDIQVPNNMFPRKWEKLKRRAFTDQKYQMIKKSGTVSYYIYVYDCLTHFHYVQACMSPHPHPEIVLMVPKECRHPLFSYSSIAL